MLRCNICLELHGSSESRFAKALASAERTQIVLGQTKNLVILPSLGPIQFGHSIIVPREHVGSFFIHADKTKRWAEVADALHQYNRSFRKVIGAKSLLIFEHGSINPSSDLCSTSHAHLHVIPLPLGTSQDIVAALEQRGSIRVKQPDVADICQKEGEFICAAEVKGDWAEVTFQVLSARALSSQWMRRQIADQLELKAWDWKSNLDVPTILAMAKIVGSTEQ